MPGCGKSTISHLVAEELRKQGKTVSEPTYDVDHKYSSEKRKVIKLIGLARYAFAFPGKYRKLIRLIKANGYSGSDLISQAVNIAPKLWAYEKAVADFVIFDEGLTQSAISLCQGKINSVDNKASLYNLSKKRKVQDIYIKVTINTALERIACRDNHDSRIEKIDDAGMRKHAIKAFEKECDLITTNCLIEDCELEDSVTRIINRLLL